MLLVSKGFISTFTGAEMASIKANKPNKAVNDDFF
jgi:hypothetical protein